MAIGKKISDLSTAATVAGTEYVEIEQTGTSKKVVITQFANTNLSNTFTTAGSAAAQITVHNSLNNSTDRAFIAFSTNSTNRGYAGVGDLILGATRVDLCLRAESGSIYFSTNSGSTAMMVLNQSGKLNLGASASASATFNIPHGAAPSSPANGDMWTTTAGLFVRVNGSTVGPLS